MEESFCSLVAKMNAQKKKIAELSMETKNKWDQNLEAVLPRTLTGTRT